MLRHFFGKNHLRRECAADFCRRDSLRKKPASPGEAEAFEPSELYQSTFPAEKAEYGGGGFLDLLCHKV